LLAVALLLTASCATYWLLEGMEPVPNSSPPAQQKPSTSLPLREGTVEMTASAETTPIAVKTSELK
jgi:hypothetical protein